MGRRLRVRAMTRYFLTGFAFGAAAMWVLMAAVAEVVW
jgi:hypothetical protein